MQPQMLGETAAKAPLAGRASGQPGRSISAASALTSRRRTIERQARRNGCARSVRRRHGAEVAAPTGVTFEADTVGGIAGLWAKPARPRKGAAIIHVHGGWFNSGTAHAYRNLVGHLGSGAGADAFIPEYRLAPEHCSAAAVTDVEACYRGLVDKGINRIAVTGDSAGGNLALVLLSIFARKTHQGWRSSRRRSCNFASDRPGDSQVKATRHERKRIRTSPSPKLPGSSPRIWVRPIRGILWCHLCTAI